MPPDLLARYRELRGEAPTASPWQAHLPHVQWVPRWVGQVCQKELPFESPNPPPIPIVGTLKQQVGLDRVWDLRHRRFAIGKRNSERLSMADLRDHFFDCYQLAKEQNKQFISQLNALNCHDPIVTFFKLAASGSTMPSRQELAEAFAAGNRDAFDQLFADALIDASVLNYDGPITSESLLAFFHGYYCNARSYNNNYRTLVGRREPLAEFFVAILKSRNIREFPRPSTLKTAMEQAIRGDQTALIHCLKDFKEVLARQQKETEIQKFTRITELSKADYDLAKQGVGPEIVNLDDPCSVCLNIVAQFPGDFPTVLDVRAVKRICADKLRNQGPIDIARDMPAASGRMASHQASRYPKLMALPNLLGAGRNLWNGEYNTAAARVARDFLPMYLQRAKHPPVPLNHILHVIENISAADAPKAPHETPPAPPLPSPVTKNLGFDHTTIKIQLEKLDSEMALDLRNLMTPHLQNGKFKSWEDYLEVRYLLEGQEKKIDQEIDGQLKRITDFANKEPLRSGDLSLQRIHLIKPKEVMRLFAEGNMAMIQRRTGLSITDSHKLIGMLLAYHQLRTKRALNKQWQTKLSKNPNITIKTKDFKLERPIDWNKVTLDQLRRYFIFESCQGPDYLLNQGDLTKIRIAFAGDAYKKLLHTYPEHAAQGFKKGSL